MRLPKVLGHALIAATVATGGLALATGTAHATYSKCLDLLAAQGYDATDIGFQRGCYEGARGNVGDWNSGCIRFIWGNTDFQMPVGQAEAACKEAAVKP